MKTTPEQTRAIICWGHQHRQMLREKYRRQFVAYSATRLLSLSKQKNGSSLNGEEQQNKPAVAVPTFAPIPR